MEVLLLSKVVLAKRMMQ